MHSLRMLIMATPHISERLLLPSAFRCKLPVASYFFLAQNSFVISWSKFPSRFGFRPRTIYSTSTSHSSSTSVNIFCDRIYSPSSLCSAHYSFLITLSHLFRIKSYDPTDLPRIPVRDRFRFLPPVYPIHAGANTLLKPVQPPSTSRIDSPHSTRTFNSNPPVQRPPLRSFDGPLQCSCIRKRPHLPSSRATKKVISMAPS